MALVVVVMFEPAVIAGPWVMVLVVVMMFEPVMIAGPAVMALLVVVIAGPIEMAEPVEYALMVSPALVVLARYDREKPNVLDRPIRYLVYATEW
jgi:hypothetical protein